MIPVDFHNIAEHGKNRMYPWEIEILYHAVMDRKPKIIVEVGSWDGCSTIAMGIACRTFGGYVYSIDPRVETILSENIKHFGIEDVVMPIKAFSPWVEGVPEHIDFLFIDGDHSTKSVLMDYYYWVHFMKRGDIIAFHDITFPAVKKALDLFMESDGKHLKEVITCKLRRRGIGIWRAC